MGSIQPGSPVSEDTILIMVPRDPMPEVIDRLKAKFPGVKIRWQNTKVKEGLMRTEDMPPAIFDGVTIVLAYQIPKPPLLPKLRFVQLSAAGSDQCADNPYYKDPNITFCTANGAHPYVIGRSFLELEADPFAALKSQNG